MTATWADLDLSDAHRDMLIESSITPDVAAARGYRTARTPDDVPAVFSESQRRRVPALVVPIWGATGDEPVAYQTRPDTPRRNTKGKPVRYETPTGSQMRVDIPRSVRADLHNTDRVLYITEGAKKVCAGVVHGLTIIGLPGVWNWKAGDCPYDLQDAVRWKGRAVRIVFDSDAAQNESVRIAERRLAKLLTSYGAHVSIVRLPDSPDGAKQGLDDWFQTGHGADELDDLCTDMPEEEDDKPNQAMEIATVVQKRYRLVRATDGQLFAVPQWDGGTAIVQTIGTDLKRSVSAYMFRERNQVVPPTALAAAIDAIKGLAFETEPVPVYLRAARGVDRVTLDLGDTTGETLTVKRDGWSMGRPSEDTPLFRRSAASQPLPMPEKGGNRDALRDLLDVDDTAWRLIWGWVVGSVFEDLPRPILWMHGPQGSAKSTRGRLIVSVVDPVINLGSPPGKNQRDDTVGAYGRYVPTMDNVSSISESVSNWLCTLVTGISTTTRELYSDDALRTFDYKRAALATSVDAPTSLTLRDDALERVLPVACERIADGARVDESGLRQRFSEAHGAIFGALLDDVAGVLHHIDAARASGFHWPRMADYAQVLAALDLHLGTAGPKSYLSTYCATVHQTMRERAEDDPLTSAVLALVEPGAAWSGTMKELLSAVNGAGDMLDESPRWWPTSARSMGSQLDKHSESLRQAGVNIGRVRAHGTRSVTLTREPASSAEPGALRMADRHPSDPNRHPKGHPAGTDVTSGDTASGACGAHGALLAGDLPTRLIEKSKDSEPEESNEEGNMKGTREKGTTGTTGTQRSSSPGSHALTAALSDIAAVVSVIGFVPGEIHRYGPTETPGFVLPTSWEPVTLLPSDGRTEPVARAGDTVDPFTVGLRCGACGTRVVLMPAVKAGADRTCPRCGTSYPTSCEVNEIAEAA